MEAAESATEKGGDINDLQRHRFIGRCWTDTAIENLLRTEEKLRHIFQKELSLREETKELENREAKDQLQALSKEFWKGTREWWSLRNELPSGAVARAFNLWQSNPK
jgi:hypothetical protein